MLAHRQPNLGVVLENVNDPHNIFAVMRTCEAVGVGKLYIIHTLKNLQWRRGRTTSGKAMKWIDFALYSTIEECMQEVRASYEVILTSDLHSGATDLYDCDLTRSTALVFGNEHHGISLEMRQWADGNFIIPMVGVTPSLNISVACAVTLYEAYRQKKQAGHYDQPALTEQQINATLRQWRK